VLQRAGSVSAVKLGARWGQLVGGNWFRIASGLTFLGVLLVLVTIALGG
jgi:hypothetical protein